MRRATCPPVTPSACTSRRSSRASFISTGRRRLATSVGSSVSFTDSSRSLATLTITVTVSTWAATGTRWFVAYPPEPPLPGEEETVVQGPPPPVGPPPGGPVGPPPEELERTLWPWLLALLFLIVAGTLAGYFLTRGDDHDHGHHDHRPDPHHGPDNDDVAVAGVMPARVPGVAGRGGGGRT